MKKLTFLFPAAFVAVMVSCTKPEVVPPPTPNGQDLSNLFASNRDGNTQSFSLNASTGGSVTGAKGTVIEIYPNTLLDASNNVVSGNVTIELIEVYDRAAMLFNNKPTMGIAPGGEPGLLVSGGAYYLNITQNGNQLHTNSYVMVKVPDDLTGGFDTNMELFRMGGGLNTNETLWELEDADTAIVADSTGGGCYGILDGEWGWTNVDRFYSDPNPKTQLLVEMPEGFVQNNCEVYVVYDDMPNCLARLDVMTEDGYFSEHYGQIPIGLHLHIVAVAMIDDELNHAIKEVTITEGSIETITELTPTTQSALATAINNF
jgi:hypothetical protein